jgi:hypothetical protein
LFSLPRNFPVGAGSSNLFSHFLIRNEFKMAIEFEVQISQKQLSTGSTQKFAILYLAALVEKLLFFV